VKDKKEILLMKNITEKGKVFLLNRLKAFYVHGVVLKGEGSGFSYFFSFFFTFSSLKCLQASK
jgi:hypothetical protein